MTLLTQIGLRRSVMSDIQALQSLHNKGYSLSTHNVGLLFDRIRELEAKLDAVEQQDSEYTRKLEVAVTAASLLPEKWKKSVGVGLCDMKTTFDVCRCADELEQTLSGKLKPEQGEAR